MHINLWKDEWKVERAKQGRKEGGTRVLTHCRFERLDLRIFLQARSVPLNSNSSSSKHTGNCSYSMERHMSQTASAMTPWLTTLMKGGAPDPDPDPPPSARSVDSPSPEAVPGGPTITGIFSAPLPSMSSCELPVSPVPSHWTSGRRMRYCA